MVSMMEMMEITEGNEYVTKVIPIWNFHEFVTSDAVDLISSESPSTLTPPIPSSLKFFAKKYFISVTMGAIAYSSSSDLFSYFSQKFINSSMYSELR